MAKRKKRAELRRQRAARQRRERIVTMIVIAGVILLVGGLFLLAAKPGAPSATPAAATDVNDIVLPPKHPHPHADMNVVGDPHAPITIVEYSDFQCPFCGKFARETEPKILQDYVVSGKVRLVYRTFGNWIGPESLLAAEAAYCAGDQGKFWDFHDILFYNQRGENRGAFNRPRIEKMAQMLKLDMEAFNACLDNHKYQQQAMQDLKDGQTAGVKGTPSFFVVAADGSQQFIEGALPYARFKEAIDAALAKGQK